MYYLFGVFGHSSELLSALSFLYISQKPYQLLPFQKSSLTPFRYPLIFIKRIFIFQHITKVRGDNALTKIWGDLMPSEWKIYRNYPKGAPGSPISLNWFYSGCGTFKGGQIFNELTYPISVSEMCCWTLYPLWVFSPSVTGVFFIFYSTKWRFYATVDWWVSSVGFGKYRKRFVSETISHFSVAEQKYTNLWKTGELFQHCFEWKTIILRETRKLTAVFNSWM